MNQESKAAEMGLSRKIMIETRSRVEEREKLDGKIRSGFFDFLPETVRKCFIYASANGEADTVKIIEELLQRKIHVYCPKVYGEKMAFFEISDYSELKPGYHRINEPVVETNQTYTMDMAAAEKGVYPNGTEDELCVVPGVIFDDKGGRMGYGFGFYDRFLGAYPCYRLALAYEIQVQPKMIELDDHDIRMDALITDRGTRVFSAFKHED